MSITKEEVQEAAEYLANGGLGEVMHALHMSGEIGMQQVVCDIALQTALCAMAMQHIANRKQPVRIKFNG